MTKLWIVSRTDQVWYDEWDSMVVAAETKEEALTYHPGMYAKAKLVEGYWKWFRDDPASSLHGEPCDPSGWSSMDKLTVQYLGTTDRDIKGVVLTSFNAG